MKKKLKHVKNKITFLLLLIVSCHFFSLHAQKIAIPISTYGIWDRGEGITDYSDPNADFVLGIEVAMKWSEIQPNGPHEFDFSIFQNTLDKAVKYNKIVKISVNVGPDCPKWVYDNGVPLVKVTSKKPEKHSKFPDYPYYLNDNYKKFYFEMIKEFSLFLRNQPQNKFDCIAFVQVKTGSTGDEEPYKGRPDDKKFAIEIQTQWQDFRLEAFNEFKKYFNDVNSRQIVLTFNNVDPVKNPEANKWVMTKMDSNIGFGIKGGAYNRGHHLTGEKEFKNQWTPYLINPKGMKLFSASEMDESWHKPLFNINTGLGFYWACLGAINVGLSSINVSKKAIKYAMEHKEISAIFKMYNKYAQQVYPSTATAAVCIFHEGLNAADTVKFPENSYGKAKKNNLERYATICKAYASRGAKMDDLKSAAIGQVNQREFQTAYNDVGWDIEDGNYERFLTQIKPDATSIGLFRVRGIIDKNSSKYDRFARSFENKTGKNIMYFKFDDEMFIRSKPKSLCFTITWLDKNVGSTWSLNYSDGDVKMKTAIHVKGIGDNQWKKQTVTINDAVINRSGKFGSDFILVNTDQLDDIFNGIEVAIERH